MADALINLLKGRTVLVQAGNAVGTGILIAPGMILTCAHVVRHAEDQPEIIKVSLPSLEDAGKPLWTELAIELYLSKKYEEPNNNQTNSDSAAIASLKKEYPDVAIIEIKRKEHSLIKFQKYKTLTGDLKEKQFLAYGFSNLDSDLERNSAEGISLIYSGEQVDGIIRKLIFVQGHIRPGMSGAALVERESGKLIGIVQMTKSKTDDLGAYVIPVETIWQVIQKYHNDGSNTLFISLRSKELEINVNKQYNKDYPQFSNLRKHWTKLLLLIILIFFSLLWGLFHTGWTTNDPITSIIFLTISSLGVILGGWLGKSVNDETGKFKDKIGKILLGKFGSLFLILCSIVLIYFWSFRSSISINGYSENEDVEISVMGGKGFKDTIRTITLNQDAKDGKASDLFRTSPFDRNGKKVKISIKDKGRSFYIDTLRSFHKIDIIYPRDFPLEPVALIRFPPFYLNKMAKLYVEIETPGRDTTIKESLQLNGSLMLGLREIEITEEQKKDWIEYLEGKELDITHADTWENYKLVRIDLNIDDNINIRLVRRSGDSLQLGTSFHIKEYETDEILVRNEK